MIRKFALASTLSLALLIAAEPKAVTEAKAKAKAGKHEEAIAQLEAAMKASPKDAPALKAGFADVYLSQGDFFMYNEQMPPFRKYPSALRSYRKVLEYDKTNAKAQKNIATIEGIYKSMGRPVPQ